MGFVATAMTPPVVNDLAAIGTVLVVVVAVEIDTGMNRFICGATSLAVGLAPPVDSAMGRVMIDEQGTRDATDGAGIEGASDGIIWLIASPVVRI